MVAIHKEVFIIRGINPAPADTQTGETGYTSINLLTTGTGGFQINNDIQGWNPGLPSAKPGLWVDVPFIDGRTPIANAVQNVIETMQVILSAQTHLLASQLLKNLYRMQQDIDAYWNDEFETEPVYLHWWAEGAPGPQFALIMGIDIDVQIPTTEDSTVVLRDVTLSIEREPYWRGIPPGANPILWTYYAHGRLPGRDFDYLDDMRLMNLIDQSQFIQDALIQDAVVENRVDYSTLTDTINGLSAHNFITIPAASIPGDAPALVQLTLQHASNDGPAAGAIQYSFIVAKSSRRQTWNLRNSSVTTGGIASYRTMIPFTAMLYNTPAGAVAADTGGINGFNVTTNALIAAKSRLEITPTANMATYATATTGLHINLQRGRFAVFVRCRQNSGSAGDIKVRVAFDMYFNNLATSISLFHTDTFIAPLVAGVGNTDFFPMLYLGSVRLPQNNDVSMLTVSNSGGDGLYNYPTRASNTTVDSTITTNISLEVQRVAGASLLYFVDLILMPFDEALCQFLTAAPAIGQAQFLADSIMVDNTGYLSRGKSDQKAISMVGNSTAVPFDTMDRMQGIVEQLGVPLTLEPGVDNTLFFIELNASNSRSSPRSVMRASVNIVPRWKGIRDS